jgi:hypothetical protein
LLLGLSLRACDHMHQGGLLSLETALIKFDENGSEVTGLPTGEYVRVSVSDTGGWSEDAGNAWTTRMGSPLVCARHASCGERANLYLPATRRHVRPVLTSN